MKKTSIFITILFLMFVLITPSTATAATLEQNFNNAKETIATATNSKKESILLFEDGPDSQIWKQFQIDDQIFQPAKIYFYNAENKDVVIAFDVDLIDKSGTTTEYSINGIKGFPIDETSVRFYPMTSLTIREIDNIVTLLDRKIRAEEIDDKLRKCIPTTKVYTGTIDSRSSKNQSEAFKSAKEIVAKSFDINSNDFSLFRYGNGYYLKPLYSDNIYLLFTTENISKDTDIRDIQRKPNRILDNNEVICCETSNADLNASAIEIVSAIDYEAEHTLPIVGMFVLLILLGYAIIVGVFFGGFFLVKKIKR